VADCENLGNHIATRQNFQTTNFSASFCQEKMSSIEEATKTASCSLLPTKSQERYKQTYENFIEWYATKDAE
jgi:hypothetical protein